MAARGRTRLAPHSKNWAGTIAGASGLGVACQAAFPLHVGWTIRTVPMRVAARQSDLIWFTGTGWRKDGGRIFALAGLYMFHETGTGALVKEESASWTHNVLRATTLRMLTTQQFPRSGEPDLLHGVSGAATDGQAQDSRWAILSWVSGKSDSRVSPKTALMAHADARLNFVAGVWMPTRLC